MDVHFTECDQCSTTRDKIDFSKMSILSLATYRIGGPAASQTPLLPGGAEGLPRPPAQGARSPGDLLRASAHCPNDEGT